MTTVTALLLIYLGTCDFTPSHTIPTVSMAVCERLRAILAEDPIIVTEAGQVTCLDIQAETQEPPRIVVFCCINHCGAEGPGT